MGQHGMAGDGRKQQETVGDKQATAKGQQETTGDSRGQQGTAVDRRGQH